MSTGYNPIYFRQLILIECHISTLNHDNIRELAAGVVGSTQALEAIRYLTGQADTLKNVLLHFDGLNMDWNRIDIRKNQSCKACSQLTPSK
ncbi:MAG: hypothetical protein QNK35_00510 [Bacteroides sp.]|nr:hypothetical protein [Bacteroides sp.]